MTEKKSLANKDNIQSNNENESEEKRTLSSKNKPGTGRDSGFRFAVIAIFFLLFIALGLCLHNHWQNTLQQTEIASLLKKITRLQIELSEKNEQNKNVSEEIQAQLITLQKQSQDNQQSIIATNDALKTANKNIEKTRERLSTMSPTENNHWLISEANYFVNLAERKIWQDQDYVTARLLLKSANNNLAATNDPSLLPARKAISQDIAALSGISQIDLSGVIFQLMSLANQISALPLVKNYEQIDISIEQHDDSFVEDSSSTLAEVENKKHNNPFLNQLKIWGKNLNKNLSTFMRNFIEVEKYDEFTDCIAKAANNKTAINQCKVYRGIISPEQSLYLRENIRLQLYVALQAVIHRQNGIYQQALIDLSNWVYAYFDTADPAVCAFLNDIEELQKQSINDEHVPKSLNSLPILNKLMQTRIRYLLMVN